MKGGGRTMNQPLVSCIVPVYNVEKYLDKCVESIVNQTYKNIEIILIDDGSSDNSPNICDKWKERDSRIIVIHKKNGGLSTARNVGLDRMTGEWVVFVDSDDYIHSQYIEVLLFAVNKYKVDLASCNYVEVNENNIIEEEKIKSIKYIKKEFIKSSSVYGVTEDIKIIVWNKIFKRNIFENIRFPINRVCEDIGVLFYILDKIENYCMVDSTLYYYQYNQESIWRKKWSIDYMDRIDVVYEQYLHFKNKGDEKFVASILEFCINCFPTNYVKFKEANIFQNFENKRIYFSRYKKILLLVLKNTNLSWKLKVKHLIFYYLPVTMSYLKENR